MPGYVPGLGQGQRILDRQLRAQQALVGQVHPCVHRRFRAQRQAAAIEDRLRAADHADGPEVQRLPLPATYRVTGKHGPQVLRSRKVAAVGIDTGDVRPVLGDDPGLLGAHDELVDVRQGQQTRVTGRRSTT